jgi:hypothetical protein
MIRTKHVTPGAWRTLETFWNANGLAFFRLPRGTQIKVRYGGGWLGFDRQKQTLDGDQFKRLEVGIWSLGYARMQVRVGQTTDITYDVYGDGVARPSPEIPF